MTTIASPPLLNASPSLHNRIKIDSPIGELQLISREDKLVGLRMHAQRPSRDTPPCNDREDACLARAVEQLEAYFAGELTDFDLEVDLQGTPFQRRVWAALREIPYGETVSYGELARHVGQPGAARAVGLANNRNPLAIVVPCHRVIGADGSLTGYGGGLERKAWLLEHEARRRPI
jgi:methylated-DNA-[protein]-cysteine S-methyltransferase